MVPKLEEMDKDQMESMAENTNQESNGTPTRTRSNSLAMYADPGGTGSRR
jgi:hypothetical protein